MQMLLTPFNIIDRDEAIMIDHDQYKTNGSIWPGTIEDLEEIQGDHGYIIIDNQGHAIEDFKALSITRDVQAGREMIAAAAAKKRRSEKLWSIIGVCLMAPAWMAIVAATIMYGE